MYEIFIFLVIFLVSALALTGLIFASGQVFEIDLSQSWVFSVIILAIFLPAVANFFIFLNPNSPEDRIEKIFALLRGFGMAITGIILLSKIYLSNVTNIFFWGGIILGAILWLGLLPFEDHYRNSKSDKE